MPHLPQLVPLVVAPSVSDTVPETVTPAPREWGGDRDRGARWAGPAGRWRCGGGGARRARGGAGGMILVPSGARVLLATRPGDFRKGTHGLAALAAEMLGHDPFSVVVLVSDRAPQIGSTSRSGARAGRHWSGNNFRVGRLAGRRWWMSHAADASGVRRRVRRHRLDAHGDAKRSPRPTASA